MAHRLIQARLKIFHVDIPLECDMSDCFAFLTQLRFQFLPIRDMSKRVGRKMREKLRLILHHLHLSLKASTIVLSRTLEIIVHLLDVGHEIREL